VLLLLRRSCQRRESRWLFMPRIDTLRDQHRRCSQRYDASDPAQTTVPNERHATIFAPLKSTNKLQMHLTFKDTSIHVEHGAPVVPSQHWQSYQMLSRPPVLLSSCGRHLALGMPAVLGDSNGVDRVTTSCEDCQLIILLQINRSSCSFRHMQSTRVDNHVTAWQCMLSLLFWNATVGPVDEWRTTGQARWPSR
jgi:hypothetical protein